MCPPTISKQHLSREVILINTIEQIIPNIYFFHSKKHNGTPQISLPPQHLRWRTNPRLKKELQQLKHKAPTLILADGGCAEGEEGRGQDLSVRLTRATAASGGADLSDDSEEVDPDAGILLEGVGDRAVRVLRLHGRRRGGSSRVALAWPLLLPLASASFLAIAWV
jgi:hypothetical protein